MERANPNRRFGALGLEHRNVRRHAPNAGKVSLPPNRTLDARRAKVLVDRVEEPLVLGRVVPRRRNRLAAGSGCSVVAAHCSRPGGQHLDEQQHRRIYLLGAKHLLSAPKDHLLGRLRGRPGARSLCGSNHAVVGELQRRSWPDGLWCLNVLGGWRVQVIWRPMLRRNDVDGPQCDARGVVWRRRTSVHNKWRLPKRRALPW